MTFYSDIRAAKPSAPLRTIAVLAGLLILLAGCATPAPKPSLAQRQTQTLTQLGFHPVDDGWMLALPANISFDVDKTDIKPEAHATLRDFARQLLDVDIRQLRTEGHTDNVGPRDYNLTLSQRRAAAVADVFLASGFTAKNVQSKGFGFDHPQADNATEAGRAQNRRVEIIVPSDALATP
ncbi:MAG: OmpA family protein [Proteobacteria bacterium]|nr:OmpA family protein [Pseudomonadota bacterium]